MFLAKLESRYSWWNPTKPSKRPPTATFIQLFSQYHIQWLALLSFSVMKTSWYSLYINSSIWGPHAGWSCSLLRIFLLGKKWCHKVRAFLVQFIELTWYFFQQKYLQIAASFLWKLQVFSFSLFWTYSFWWYKISFRVIILNYTSTKETPIEFTCMVHLS